MMNDRNSDQKQQQEQQQIHPRLVTSPLHLRDETGIVESNEQLSSILLPSSLSSRLVEVAALQSSTGNFDTNRFNDNVNAQQDALISQASSTTTTGFQPLRHSKSFVVPKSPKIGRKLSTSPLMMRSTSTASSSNTQVSPKFTFLISTSIPTGPTFGTTIPATTTITTSTNTYNSTGSPSSNSTSKKTTTTSAATSRRIPSRSSSTMSEGSDELPNNVSNEEQLDLLPDECLSGNSTRPLQHFTEDGVIMTYALRPMSYSVIFILIVELLERFAFYGINYTQTSYLTGVYNPSWNAGMESVVASSYVSISVAVAYTTPFIGAYFADQIFGDYYTILLGSIVFYIPGLFLIAFTTVPKLLGPKFNTVLLQFGLLFLWPVGTGIVKSVVNVFGAKQFHPLLQSTLIEAYYINFYMCINIGALIGGIAVPVLAQHNVTVAYFLPVSMLCLGLLLFLAGSSRYVRTSPKRKKKCLIIPSCCKRTKRNKSKTQNNNHRMKQAVGNSINHNINNKNNKNNISLLAIAKVSFLIVPFNIAYSQMGTTFVVQGTVMNKAFGWIDAATMNNADAVAVLLFGYIIGNKLYPWLTDRGIKIPTTYKFAIGSAFGAVSIASALIIDIMIHNEYNAHQRKISILWQTIPYVLIGVGEIFAVSAAYEVAFTASPPDMKVLCSAMNLFCIGGIPNVVCIGLYQVCRPWFENSHGDTRISHIRDYASARVDKYFCVLFLISLLGVVINLLPSARDYVESIEEKAVDMIRTPKTPIRPPIRDSIATTDEENDDDFQSSDDDNSDTKMTEAEQLLKVKRHEYYLKYGSGPSLCKMGSMRAGPSLKSKSLSNVTATTRTGSSSTAAGKLITSSTLASGSKRIKKTMLKRLYNSEATILIPKSSKIQPQQQQQQPQLNVILSATGKPIRGCDMPLLARSKSFENKGSTSNDNNNNNDDTNV